MNRPPKNMISVSRKSHMPKLAVSRCWSTVTKWWRRYAGCASSCSSWGSACPGAIAWLSNGRYLVLGVVLQPVIVVCLVIHDWYIDKVLCQRRRLNLPFQASRLPGVTARDLTVLERPGHIEHRQQITDAKYRGARCRQDIQHLELRRISMVAARHAQVANDELGEEGQDESNERGDRAQLRHGLGRHSARHLGPPEVDARQVSHQHAAHHHKVEMGDDEVGFGEMDVHAQGTQKDSGETADGKQPHEAEGIKHGGLKGE